MVGDYFTAPSTLFGVSEDEEENTGTIKKSPKTLHKMTTCTTREESGNSESHIKICGDHQGSNMENRNMENRNMEKRNTENSNLEQLKKNSIDVKPSLKRGDYDAVAEGTRSTRSRVPGGTFTSMKGRKSTENRYGTKHKGDAGNNKENGFAKEAMFCERNSKYRQLHVSKETCNTFEAAVSTTGDHASLKTESGNKNEDKNNATQKRKIYVLKVNTPRMPRRNRDDNAGLVFDSKKCEKVECMKETCRNLGMAQGGDCGKMENLKERKGKLKMASEGDGGTKDLKAIHAEIRLKDQHNKENAMRCKTQNALKCQEQTFLSPDRTTQLDMAKTSCENIPIKVKNKGKPEIRERDITCTDVERKIQVNESYIGQRRDVLKNKVVRTYTNILAVRNARNIDANKLILLNLLKERRKKYSSEKGWVLTSTSVTPSPKSEGRDMPGFLSEKVVSVERFKKSKQSDNVINQMQNGAVTQQKEPSPNSEILREVTLDIQETFKDTKSERIAKSERKKEKVSTKSNTSTDFPAEDVGFGRSKLEQVETKDQDLFYGQTQSRRNHTTLAWGPDLD